MQKISKQKSKLIAKLYKIGESSISIAKKLKIPVRTTITHLHYNKLRIRTQKEAVLLALKKNRLKIRLRHIPKKSKLLTEAKAYILGVLCGDGWSYYNNVSPKQTYQVGLDATDKDFVNKFSNCLYIVYGLNAKRTKRKKRNAKWQIIFVSRICSKKVCDDLLSYGVFKTKIWRIPKVIFNSKSSIQCSFLKGFFDSEGSVSKNDKRITGTSSNFEGLSDVKKLLTMLNIDSRITISRSIYYNLNITGRRSIEKFLSLISFSIKRKSKRLKALVKSYKFYMTLKRDVDKLVPKIKYFKASNHTYEEISKILNISIGTVWRRFNTPRDPTRLSP
jgi:intein-encoded DNA endonuclease-like protein